MLEEKFQCNMDQNLADSPDSGKYSVCLDFSESDLDTSGYIMGKERERKPVIRTLNDEYELQDVQNGIPTSTPKKRADLDTTRPVGETTIVMDVTEEPSESASNLFFVGHFFDKMDDIVDNVKVYYCENRKMTNFILGILVFVCFLCFLVVACVHNLENAKTLLILTGVGAALFLYTVIRDTMGDSIYERGISPVEDMMEKAWPYIKWPFVGLILIGLAVVLYFLTKDNPIQLVSFGGLLIFILFTFVFSKHPRHVKVRPVAWGLALQFLLGLFILRTHPGFVIFQWMGDLVQVFLGFSTAGSLFLFGDAFYEHYFAMAVLPIIIYFSSAIAILYYLGVMQVVIQKIAWLMQRTMKTSATESLNAAGNIFIGQTEAPLLIRPYLASMTRSEIHAVMTGGFATIAGSVLGAFVLNGISATHLIAASVMSAPAALAISKLFYPETEHSKTITEDDVKLPKGEERNIIEAASKGASIAVPLVLNIAANLIAFLALLAFVNGVLGYLGGLVGYPELSFEIVCSYVFMPVAYIMGVPWHECGTVAELIGVKTFINEFVAYDKLSKILADREAGLNNFSERSEVIATYALCGFANIGSVGIQLGGLTPMAPSKAKDLAAVAVRALIAGTIACFMTACIAGVLFVPQVATDVAMNVTANATFAATTMETVTMFTVS